MSELQRATYLVLLVFVTIKFQWTRCRQTAWKSVQDSFENVKTSTNTFVNADPHALFEHCLTKTKCYNDNDTNHNSLNLFIWYFHCNEFDVHLSAMSWYMYTYTCTLLTFSVELLSINRLKTPKKTGKRGIILNRSVLRISDIVIPCF